VQIGALSPVSLHVAAPPPPTWPDALTRRVSKPRFLLRAGPFVNGVVRYALARAAQLNPLVALHGFVAQSNHTHASASHPYGAELPVHLDRGSDHGMRQLIRRGVWFARDEHVSLPRSPLVPNRRGRSG